MPASNWRALMPRIRAKKLSASSDRPGPAELGEVHAVTDRMYAALADRLGGDAGDARRQAVAVHTAVLGLMLILGLADSLDDPLKHGQTELVEALVARLA